MATLFKNKVIRELGVTPQDLITTNGATRATVIGLSFANLTDSIVSVSVTLTDDLDTTGFYAKDIEIAPQTSLRAVNGGEKLIVAPNNTLSVYADRDYAVDVIVSYVEIV
jgi:hypothetical protein